MDALFHITNSNRQELSDLFDLVETAYQPLLLSLTQRKLASRLRSLALGQDDEARRSVLYSCADKKEQVAQRIEAIYPDAELLEQELEQDLQELQQWEQSLLPLTLPDMLWVMNHELTFSIAQVKALAEAEGNEQGCHTLLSCAVLLEKCQHLLQNLK
jgi:hypothetical protein